MGNAGSESSHRIRDPTDFNPIMSRNRVAELYQMGFHGLDLHQCHSGCHFDFYDEAPKWLNSKLHMH